MKSMQNAVGHFEINPNDCILHQKEETNRCYLSPFAPIPLWTSELVTVSNIDRLGWVITVAIINKLIVHRLWINATDAANLLSTFFAASHRALAVATGPPLVLGHSGSRIDGDCVVVEYWLVAVVVRDSRRGDSVSGCSRDICVRCLLNLDEKKQPGVDG